MAVFERPLELSERAELDGSVRTSRSDGADFLKAAAFFASQIRDSRSSHRWTRRRLSPLLSCAACSSVAQASTGRRRPPSARPCACRTDRRIRSTRAMVAVACAGSATSWPAPAWSVRTSAPTAQRTARLRGCIPGRTGVQPSPAGSPARPTCCTVTGARPSRIWPAATSYIKTWTGWPTWPP